MVGDDPESFADLDGHVTCDPDKVTWGPNGVTVTPGMCHLDALDWLRRGYNGTTAISDAAFRPVRSFARDFATGVASGLLTTLQKGLSDCGCGDKDNNVSTTKNKPSERFGWRGGAKWR